MVVHVKTPAAITGVTTNNTLLGTSAAFFTPRYTHSLPYEVVLDLKDWELLDHVPAVVPEDGCDCRSSDHNENNETRFQRQHGTPPGGLFEDAR